MKSYKHSFCRIWHLLSLCFLSKRFLLPDMISDFCVFWDAYHPSKTLQIYLRMFCSYLGKPVFHCKPVCVRGLTSCQAVDFLKVEPVSCRPVASKVFFLYDPRLIYFSQIWGLECENF